MKCRRDLLVIIYTKPYETSRTLTKIVEYCTLVNLNEEMGRITVSCPMDRFLDLKPILQSAEAFSAEPKLICKARKCNLKLAECKIDNPCIYSGRIIYLSKRKYKYELKIGPKSSFPPRGVLPASIFYTTELDDLFERIRFIDEIVSYLNCE